MITALIQPFRDRYYRKAPMVKYWKTQDSVEAKVYQHEEGHTVMQMKGEKYPFPGHPRGSLLFGSLSPLKHQVKNKIFNAVWALLDEKKDRHEIEEYLNSAWGEIFTLSEQSKYDMVPFEKMCPAVKELWRAMTAVEDAGGHVKKLKELVCFILQEDDAYRMRFQWLAKFMPRWRTPTFQDFDKALAMAENAEIIGDMKERQRLFRRVITFLAKDSDTFKRFLKEINWKKVGLTEADKYFFRAKYYKVDFPEYQY